ncbi:unnamed protein product [Ceratitis capitata]|uniref:(Mediterranean fruit fly) hypothetical protein n=1 Tax=Ceratitis capitata TaxID=7213 RepID=A0A811UHU2_CERCA|nr:unnamed protein product [Ceratitis capitata]
MVIMLLVVPRCFDSMQSLRRSVKALEQVEDENYDNAFFDSRGIVHKEFLSPGQTDNQVYCRQVLKRLRKRDNRVHPDIGCYWIIHHDIAPCHTALSVSQYLASKGNAVLQQPSYSSDMSPWDPKTKSVVKGTHFLSIEDIQSAVTRELTDIPVEAL